MTVENDVVRWGVDRVPRNRGRSPLLAVPERELVLVRWLARSMDSRWRLGPFRFGVESLLRFVPVLGGTSSLALSLYQVVLALRLRLPPRKLVRMTSYIGVDLTLGLIPYLGDLADAWFRVHLRNQRLIDHYLDSVEAEVRLRLPPRSIPRPMHEKDQDHDNHDDQNHHGQEEVPGAAKQVTPAAGQHEQQESSQNDRQQHNAPLTADRPREAAARRS